MGIAQAAQRRADHGQQDWPDSYKTPNPKDERAAASGDHRRADPVEMYQPDSEYERGVIGLGEPPVIPLRSGDLSNAVANAIGVRVPVAAASLR